MRYFFKPTTLALALVATLPTQFSFAGDLVEATDPLELVITPSRTLQAKSTVPASITVINKKQITQSAVISVSDLLKIEPALNMYTAGGGRQQTSTFTRGTNSNHTLYLQDGVRLNPATSSIGNPQFMDLSDIDRIEILKGPASVQYGSDAIGGVVQLVTKAPTKNKFTSTIEVGDYDTYKAVVGGDLVQDDLYLQVRGQRLETDGSFVNNKVDFKSGYEQKGGAIIAGVKKDTYDAKLEYKQNEGTAEYVGYPNVPVAQDFKNSVALFKVSADVTPDVRINGRVSESKDILNQKSSADYARTKHQEADLNVNFALPANQHVMLGGHTRNTDTKYLSYGSNKSGDFKTEALYAQHNLDSDRVNTQVGFRHEKHSIYGESNVGQVSGRVHLSDKTSDYANSVYLNAGTAFHAPDSTQLFGKNSNPNLLPEESKSIELGFDQKIGQDISVGITAYDTKVRNLIASVEVAKYVYVPHNVSKARMQGGELKLSAQVSDFVNVFAGYAYVVAKDTTTDKDLLRRPRHSVTAGINVGTPTMGVGLDMLTRSSAQEYSAVTPSYVVGNLKAFWQATSNVKVVANVLNIANVHYATANNGGGSYYLAAPRQASLGLTFTY